MRELPSVQFLLESLELFAPLTPKVTQIYDTKLTISKSKVQIDLKKFKIIHLKI